MGRTARIGSMTGALVCFAANSLLCRFALGEGRLDASSWTAVRIVAGAATLFVLAWAVGPASAGAKRRLGPISGLALFVYAACFSYAYLELSTAAGGILLFGSVQVTMVLAGLLSGERLTLRHAIGLGLAASGVVLLLSPGVDAPDPRAALLMGTAGIAWAVYSLRGRGSRDPLRDAAGSFLFAALLIPLLVPFIGKEVHVTTAGIALAVASGALASGVGYLLWFAALQGLSRISAATVQLAVPVLTAAGGMILLSEPPSLRFWTSLALVLGGVGLTLTRKRRQGSYRSVLYRPGLTGEPASPSS